MERSSFGRCEACGRLVVLSFFPEGQPCPSCGGKERKPYENTPPLWDIMWPPQPSPKRDTTMDTPQPEAAESTAPVEVHRDDDWGFSDRTEDDEGHQGEFGNHEDE